MAVPARVYCVEPMFDEDGVTEIGGCGWFLPGDERAQKALAAAFGWDLEPVPRCPGHAAAARRAAKRL